MRYSSHFKDTLTKENHPFFKRMEIITFDTHRRLFAIISPYEYMQRHSSESCLFLSEKACDVHWKKPLRNKFLWKAIFWKKELILSIKSWETKKKLNKPVTNLLTRITDWKIPIVYSCLSNNKKSRTWSVWFSTSHW